MVTTEHRYQILHIHRVTIGSCNIGIVEQMPFIKEEQLLRRKKPVLEEGERMYESHREYGRSQRLFFASFIEDGGHTKKLVLAPRFKIF